MDKTAQKRGKLNELREFINLPGKTFEGMFKPELQKVMDKLQEVDDKIRAILTGVKIDTAPAPADKTSAKALLKSARSKFNRREYMAGVSDLGHFHRKMFEVDKELNELSIDVSRIHHKFLFEGLEKDEYDQKLQSLRDHMTSLTEKKASAYDTFVKEAGIMDTLVNIGTPRGWSLAAWEKKYPKFTKELRDRGNKLVDDAFKLLDNTILNLKVMATARATRKPDSYIDAGNKIKMDFSKFDSSFRDYYSKEVDKLLKLKDAIEAADKAEHEKELAKQKEQESPLAGATTGIAAPGNITMRDMPPAQPPPEGVPSLPGASEGAPLPTPPAAPEAPAPAPAAPAPELNPNQKKRLEIAQKGKVPEKAGHQNFYASLEAMSGESPLILAKYITKYASSIQASDPETAIELFDIARRVKG